MSYAFDKAIEDKSNILFEKLGFYLTTLKNPSLLFKKGDTVYIPDIHGDFVHLIVTLFQHDLLENNLDLKKDFTYVFLGDFYDRAPDSDVLDFWVNKQIEKEREIYRLIGNHEMAFFEIDENNYPVIFPSQDSIKDVENNFRITENLLKSLAEGTILATYVDCRDALQCVSTMYIHSFIVNDDFKELGLKPDSSIFDFAHLLNARLKHHGEYAYNVFLDCKKKKDFNWKEILKSFNSDPMFNLYEKKNDLNTSFLWRRTGIPVLKVYPVEMDADIPENLFQIVGHTPVFSFNLPGDKPVTEPFILGSKNSTGCVQFSDVGIGYYYRNDDFERPEVVIRKLERIVSLDS